MTSKPATRLHVSGHRFLLRRMEAAITGKATQAVSQAARTRALLGGGLLTVVVTVAGGLLSSMRPSATLPDAPIIMGAESGALYVRLGETLHPVFNLASARLIAEVDADPRPVRESGIGHAKRGPLLGIPDAPRTVPQPVSPNESTWTVCDSEPAPTTTIIVGGEPQRRESTALHPEQTVLVSAGPQTTYLLYGGRRAVVDPTDPAVTGALHLEGVTSRPVSRLLLAAVPEAPPVAAPTIPSAGQPGPATLPGALVGSVVRMPRIGGDDEYYAVLTNGIQPVGQVTAELLRRAESHGRGGIGVVSPDAVRATPMVRSLAVSTFPDRSAPVRGAAAVLCARWTPSVDDRDGVELSLGAGLPLPPGQAPVALAQADGSGPALDAVYVPPARSAYVQAGGVRYLITDTGARFAIHDDNAARSLGLPATPAPAPWPMLAGLPQGPELARSQALIARDAVRSGPPKPAGHQRNDQHPQADRRAEDRRIPAKPGRRRRCRRRGDRHRVGHRGGHRRRRIGAERRPGVDGAVADERIPIPRRVVGGGLETGHHLPGRQPRKPGTNQCRQAADYRSGIASSPDRFATAAVFCTKRVDHRITDRAQ